MSKLISRKRCYFCSDLGAELSCIQCNRGYHRDCSRHCGWKSDDELVFDDCENEDDDDDYGFAVRRVTPRCTSRPRRKSGIALTHRRIGEFRRVSQPGALSVQDSVFPSFASVSHWLERWSPVLAAEVPVNCLGFVVNVDGVYNF